MFFCHHYPCGVEVQFELFWERNGCIFLIINSIVVMMPFKFKLIEKCFQDSSRFPGDDADFYLEENDWNDYYYYVLYHLHVTKRITGGGNMFLGDVRIMRVGQQKNEKYLLAQEFGRSVFSELPPDFVSISFEYGLFKWLSFRPLEERQLFVSQLHMILNVHSPFYGKVKDDGCFITAMLRDSSMDNYVLIKADQWINQIERRYDLRKQVLTLKYDNCDEEVSLSFSCLPDITAPEIPNGIVAFIGSNGAGKSTALYSLAKAMYLYPEDRERLERKFCKIKPNDIGVERLILVSYSPFDNFTLPTTTNYALDQVPGQSLEADGRFIYCGIRDMDLEYKELFSSGEQKDVNYLQKDRQELSIVKTQQRLAADFAYAFNDLRSQKKSLKFWTETIEKAKVSMPDLAEKMESMTKLSKQKDWAEYFMTLSTGYKFFFHSMSYLLAYLVDGSLVLFDEPENHIHPPLLSFMMARYRGILSEYNSVMLVSTHSPVIVQELFADNVLKVFRDGKMICIRKPEIETYGATFGDINTEVFGLTADVSGFFKAIDTLYEAWDLSNAESAVKMLEEMQRRLQRPVSNQVASYLISRFYNDNPDNN